MSYNDPIADMLTRIRNGQNAGLSVVEMQHSKMKEEIVRVLKKEGFLTDCAVEGGVKKVMRVYLKYGSGQEPAIQGLKRESKPGLRRYSKADGFKKLLGGMGYVIVSTSQGIMTGREAKRRKLGGEVVCTVW